MKISAQQLQAFDRDGYLFFPELFRPEEIKVLADEVPALYAQRRPENVRERTGDVVRTNFAAHMYSAPFARLARHPRMVTRCAGVRRRPVHASVQDQRQAGFRRDVGSGTRTTALGGRRPDARARAMNVAISWMSQ
jgi:hypothetical protein